MKNEIIGSCSSEYSAPLQKIVNDSSSNIEVIPDVGWHGENMISFKIKGESSVIEELRPIVQKIIFK